MAIKKQPQPSPNSQLRRGPDTREPGVQFERGLPAGVPGTAPHVERDTNDELPKPYVLQD